MVRNQADILLLNYHVNVGCIYHEIYIVKRLSLEAARKQACQPTVAVSAEWLIRTRMRWTLKYLFITNQSDITDTLQITYYGDITIHRHVILHTIHIFHNDQQILFNLLVKFRRVLITFKCTLLISSQLRCVFAGHFRPQPVQSW